MRKEVILLSLTLSIPKKYQYCIVSTTYDHWALPEFFIFLFPMRWSLKVLDMHNLIFFKIIKPNKFTNNTELPGIERHFQKCYMDRVLITCKNKALKTVS